MKLSNNERKILDLLFRSSNGLEAYTIYRRLRQSLGVFSSSIIKLIQASLVEENEARYLLSEKGKEYVLKSQDKYVFSHNKTWRDVPDSFKQQAVSSAELYIPSRSRLDGRHFKKD